MKPIAVATLTHVRIVVDHPLLGIVRTTTNIDNVSSFNAKLQSSVNHTSRQYLYVKQNLRSSHVVTLTARLYGPTLTNDVKPRTLIA